MAFWDYNSGTHLTKDCDDDIERLCPDANRKQGVFSIGVVARCLSKQLASSLPLRDACRRLVSVAAPRDVRLYLKVRENILCMTCLSCSRANVIAPVLQETMNPDGSLRGGYLQSAMDTAATAKSFITLNGWVAVLSVLASIAVVVAGALFALRRYTGMDKPYTRFVSADDADMDDQSGQ